MNTHCKCWSLGTLGVCMQIGNTNENNETSLLATRNAVPACTLTPGNAEVVHVVTHMYYLADRRKSNECYSCISRLHHIKPLTLHTMHHIYHITPLTLHTITYITSHPSSYTPSHQPPYPIHYLVCVCVCLCVCAHMHV